MKNALKMLNVVWPNGIPAQEYAKALEVIRAASEKKTRSARAERTPKPNEEKVRSALSTGPATAREVADVAGLTVMQAKYALMRIATAVGSRPNPNGLGLPAILYALKKGA